MDVIRILLRPATIGTYLKFNIYVLYSSRSMGCNKHRKCSGLLTKNNNNNKERKVTYLLLRLGRPHGYAGNL